MHDDVLVAQFIYSILELAICQLLFTISKRICDDKVNLQCAYNNMGC